MQDRRWLSSYPEGVPHDINPALYSSLVDLMEQAFTRYAARTAYHFMGKDVSFAQVDRDSLRMAAYLQSLGLQRGDRVAIMMPNVPQYPIALAAILRAGLVVVNVNPLYTARELQHQLQDSGAKAIFIIENFAHTLQKCIAQTAVQHVVLCTMGDMLGTLKGAVVNYVVRNIKKMVPAFTLPKAVPFHDALARAKAHTLSRPHIGPDDIAVLQYTGGTTGVSKGATLLHRNVVANVLQSDAWYEPALRDLIAQGTPPVMVCALPLYHIFGFTVNMMLGLHAGGKNILIPNPRDIPGVLKELRKHTFHCLPAVNTLFNALARHPDFGTVDWSHLRTSVGGGMAVQSTVAQLWLEKTGCPICEGYGLSETSPIVSCNPLTNKTFTGTIGVPVPNTYVKLIDANGQEVTTLGQTGEVAVRGPQVMAGYWQRPAETAQVMTADGFFLTGDIGTMDAQGFIKIVDRKKDMVLVSGFNVYPNEVEEVASQCPGVQECAAIGVPDEHTGEAVKLVVVRSDPQLSAQQLRDFCRERLTNYKQPRLIEFRDELPKTPVGKILRRELRDTTPQPTGTTNA